MKKYLIKKYDLYYRPNAAGYTSSISEAWKLPYDEAIKYTGSKGQPDEVKLEEAPPCNMLENEDGYYYREGNPLLGVFCGRIFRCGWSYSSKYLTFWPVSFSTMDDICSLQFYHRVENDDTIKIIIDELKDNWTSLGGNLDELTRLATDLININSGFFK